MTHLKNDIHICSTGRKRPSIVNGSVNRSQNKENPKDIVTQPCAGKQELKPNKHAVKIIGDSHLRDSARRINQYLNSKYEATGIIKPEATTQKIVTRGENELKGLCEKDVIVLNCDANDIEKVNSNISTIITPVINFSQKYSNTNIIVLEIPHRHDLHHKDMTNLHIQSLNTKLKTILTRFRHVTILHMNTTRNHFTKHGLHLNNPGKEWLARKIASQIDRINKTREIPGNPIPLKMTVDVPYMKPTNIDTLQENKQTDQKTTASQGQITQDKNINNHTNCRSSTRVKKTPSVMYSDFLWQTRPQMQQRKSPVE